MSTPEYFGVQALANVLCANSNIDSASNQAVQQITCNKSPVGMIHIGLMDEVHCTAPERDPVQSHPEIYSTLREPSDLQQTPSQFYLTPAEEPVSQTTNNRLESVNQDVELGESDKVDKELTHIQAQIGGPLHKPRVEVIAPDDAQEPLDLITGEHFEEMSTPTKYPHGRGIYAKRKNIPVQNQGLLRFVGGLKCLSHAVAQCVVESKQVCVEANMVRQLGSPSSLQIPRTANLQWPDIIQTIARQYGTELKEKISSEKSMRPRLNPIAADHRFYYWLKCIIQNTPTSSISELAGLLFVIVIQRMKSSPLPNPDSDLPVSTMIAGESSTYPLQATYVHGCSADVDIQNTDGVAPKKQQVTIKAIDQVKNTYTALFDIKNRADTRGLVGKLFSAVRAKVMDNGVSDGLVNGAIGTVRGTETTRSLPSFSLIAGSYIAFNSLTEGHLPALMLVEEELAEPVREVRAPPIQEVDREAPPSLQEDTILGTY